MGSCAHGRWTTAERAAEGEANFASAEKRSKSDFALWKVGQPHPDLASLSAAERLLQALGLFCEMLGLPPHHAPLPPAPLSSPFPLTPCYFLCCRRANQGSPRGTPLGPGAARLAH